MKKISIVKNSMIVLLCSTIVCLCHTAYAGDKSELLFGSLTQHFTNFGGVSSRFDNKVSRDGTLIANPLVAYRILHTEDDLYTSSAIFGGQNSIGEAMAGLGFSTGFEFNKMRLGLTAGGYLQDDQKFRDRDIQPFTMSLGSRFGLAPVVGIEFQMNLPIGDDTYLTMYNLITPVLSNTTIGFGWNL